MGRLYFKRQLSSKKWKNLEKNGIIVTSVAESKRLFGINFNTASVTGTVRVVIVPPRGSGKKTSVRVDWSIGGIIKRKDVKICNLTFVEPESLPHTGSNTKTNHNRTLMLQPKLNITLLQLVLMVI